MAGHKGQGSTQNGRNSPGQRLGLKAFGGEFVTAGSILVRQCGTRWHPAKNVGIAKNDTIYALVDGTVKFGRHHGRTTVSIIPTA